MPVREEMRGNVLVITLDRPEARNALDGATMECLRERFELLAAQRPIPAGDPAELATAPVGTEPDDWRPHVVLLRAEGTLFCAGADLDEMRRLGAADFQENLAAALAMGAMFRAIRNCPAPVIARVQGPAYGGGVGLVCACDVVVASQEATFTFSEVKLGLVPGVIAPLVIDRIGQAATRAGFLTAEPMRAVDAFRIGLIDRLSDTDGLDAAIDRTVVALLKGGPGALGRAKSLIDGSVTLGFDRSSEFTAKMIAEARTSREAQAALSAFFAREPAPWTQAAEWPQPEDGSE